MQFFIPAATTTEERDRVYVATKNHLSQGQKDIFSDRRIRVLQWSHNGKRYEAEVGKETTFNGELVIAILYQPSHDLYHVCTPNRGVIRDMAILAGGGSVLGSLDFETD